MRRGYRMAAALALLAAAGAAGAQTVGLTGPATVTPEDSDTLQDAASVVVVNDLARQGRLGGKLFGAAGGDPAMNGLNTFLAFYLSPDQGWRVFPVGDYLSYRILSETPGRVLLLVQESTMNQATSEIGERSRRVLLSWTPGSAGAPPATVRVATAPPARRRAR